MTGRRRRLTKAGRLARMRPIEPPTGGLPGAFARLAAGRTIRLDRPCDFAYKPTALHIEALGAQVAQLVEHVTENPGVGGSNPPLGTILNLLESIGYWRVMPSAVRVALHSCYTGRACLCGRGRDAPHANQSPVRVVNPVWQRFCAGLDSDSSKGARWPARAPVGAVTSAGRSTGLGRSGLALRRARGRRARG